jgi:hypothetical protein
LALNPQPSGAGGPKAARRALSGSRQLQQQQPFLGSFFDMGLPQQVNVEHSPSQVQAFVTVISAPQLPQV